MSFISSLTWLECLLKKSRRLRVAAVCVHMRILVFRVLCIYYIYTHLGYNIKSVYFACTYYATHIKHMQGNITYIAYIMCIQHTVYTVPYTNRQKLFYTNKVFGWSGFGVFRCDCLHSQTYVYNKIHLSSNKYNIKHIPIMRLSCTVTHVCRLLNITFWRYFRCNTLKTC